MKSIEPLFCLEGKSSERSTVPISRNLQVWFSDFQFFPKLKTQLLKEEFDMKPADMKFDEFRAKFPDVCICKGIGWTLVHVLLSFMLYWRLNGHSVDDLWICQRKQVQALQVYHSLFLMLFCLYTCI